MNTHLTVNLAAKVEIMASTVRAAASSCSEMSEALKRLANHVQVETKMIKKCGNCAKFVLDESKPSDMEANEGRWGVCKWIVESGRDFKGVVREEWGSCCGSHRTEEEVARDEAEELQQTIEEELDIKWVEDNSTF